MTQDNIPKQIDPLRSIEEQIDYIKELLDRTCLISAKGKIDDLIEYIEVTI